jgi:DNA-binding response OmpR family regulator
MKILIIEDDKMVSTYLTHELQLSGHIVSVASEGAKGLQLLSNENFDLCIMDLLLPGNSGFQILSTIQNEWKMDIPIFVMSQLKDAEAILIQQNLRYNNFFQKPVDALKLFQCIELLLMV